MKEKILHVFSIKMVVPYEAATQKAKNGAYDFSKNKAHKANDASS